MAKNRYKGGGAKRESGGFSPWPHACATHPNYLRLSIKAKALLFEFVGQYRGNNNGDLCCAWALMRERGWRSRTTVETARDELEETGWTILTRQGGRNSPNLYALTLYEIDDCRGKLDKSAPVGKTLGFWKLGHNPMMRPRSQAA